MRRRAKIKVLDEQKTSLLEEIKWLQLAVTNLTSTKDKLLNEIADQRKGQNNRTSQYNKIIDEIGEWLTTISELNDVIKVQRLLLDEMTNRKTKELNELNKQIKLKKQLIEAQKAIVLIDKKALNEQYEAELNITKAEVNKMNDTLKKLQKDAEKLIKDRVDFKVYKKSKENELEERLAEARKRDRKTKAYAKLLHSENNKNGKN